MRQRLLVAIGAVLAIVLATAEPALACPVCFGASDSPMATGLNNGILVLLGVNSTEIAHYPLDIFNLKWVSERTAQFCRVLIN